VFVPAGEELEEMGLLTARLAALFLTSCFLSSVNKDSAFVQDAVHPVSIKVNPYNKCVQCTHIK